MTDDEILDLLRLVRENMLHQPWNRVRHLIGGIDDAMNELMIRKAAQ